MGRVDGDVDLLPGGVVKIFTNKDALEFADQVGMQVELSLTKLQAEVGVALANGHQPVADGRSELHVELITLKSKEREGRNIKPSSLSNSRLGPHSTRKLTCPMAP